MTTKFNGIVVFQRDYREHDLLVKMITDSIGPAMFLIRGAKRKNFKWAADIQPLAHGQYVGVLNNDGLSFINAVSESNIYPHLVGNLEPNAYATYILELVDTAFSEGVPMGAWFGQVAAAMDKINAGLDPQIIANVMEVQLLGKFGVQPTWGQCVICGQNRLPFDFSERYGGMLCQRHWYLDQNRMHLDQKTVAFVQQLSTLNLRQLHSVSVNAVTKRRLAWFLDTLYDDEVGLNLKSKRFIKQLHKWQRQLALRSGRQKGQNEK